MHQPAPRLLISQHKQNKSLKSNNPPSLTMELGAPNGGVVNMTRALEAVAPMLNNPRKTIAKVEVLVSVAAALMFFQFILRSCKRLWHNSVVSFFLKILDKSMFPFIVFILGTMQTSLIKNSVYPVWAVSLIMASEATSAVKPSDLPSIGNLMSFYVELARYTFYFIVFSQLLNPTSLKDSWPFGHQFLVMRHNRSSDCTAILLGLVFISKFLEATGRLMFGFSYSRRVAKWTKENLTFLKNDQSNCDPRSMKDYNFLVRYPIAFMTLDSKVTTVDQIWDCFQNSGDRISADDKKILKDICLSFAFFELLKRRYFGWIWVEASLQKTQDFVLKVLLSPPDGDYKRAFRIVETELGFCYDLLCTRHQLIYATGLFLPLCVFCVEFFLCKIILIFFIGVYALNNSLFLETPSPIIEVHSDKADYNIAVLFLGMILTVKLSQAAIYLASDWLKISLTCMYVKSSAPILEKALGFLCRIRISVRCRNTIGQCSFISDRNKMRTPEVKVSDAVKKAIANSLISTDGELTKGERALRKYKMFDEYSWTLKDHSQIEVMLIWHIATDYCNLALSDAREDRDIAVNLSRYYAYLITFVEELLPYYEGDIRELRATVREEIKTLPSRRSSEIYDIVLNLQGTEKEDNPSSVFMKGVKLGKQLSSMSNGAQPWKMISEFWAETIIYITPSQATAKQHMEHLESGGEFLTQIWVLLSHAGILNLDREKDQGPKRAKPETA